MKKKKCSLCGNRMRFIGLGVSPENEEYCACPKCDENLRHQMGSK